MAIPLTINGAVFEYPQNFDEDWGINATGWAQAVTAGALYLSGGNFPLTATVDFGSNFGLKAKSLASKTVNPATAGYLLLAKSDAIEWRNNANSANLSLGIDGSDNLTFNGSVLGTSSLTDAHIFVGNASNVPVGVLLSGDATLANTGALTIANSAITNAKVSASAAIAVTKLAPLTGASAVQTSVGGVLQASPTSATELAYLSGVTSSVQTQLDAHLPLSGGTMSGAIAMASHKITSLASGTSTGDAVNFGQLHLMQLPVFASEQTGGTTTSASFVAAGASVTITPTSSSSKIVIFGMGLVNVATNSDANPGILGLARNGTALFSPTASPAKLVTGGTTSTFAASITVFYLDAPATTSAVTYQLMIASGAGTTVNLGGAAGAGNSTYILVAEVA